ncbi:MAG: 4a-hydroxytetrahydrobiopterin dehydratase [Planctomycetota bacterium]
MTDKIKRKEVKARLIEIRDWEIYRKALQKEFKFPDFKGAFQFLEKVSNLANKANHHPDFIYSNGKLTIRLITHEVDGITEKDIQLAKEIDNITR